MASEHSEEIRNETRRATTRVMCLIAGFFVLLGVAAGLITLRIISADYETVRSNAFQKADLLAESYATHLRQAINDTDVLARFVAFESKSTHPLTINEMVSQQLITPGDARLVTVTDANGLVTQTWPAPLAHRVYLTDRPHYVIHKNNPDTGLYVGTPVVGRISGEWTIQFSRRINNPDGSFGGVVVISKPPTFIFAGAINSASIGPMGTAVVFRSDGTFLVRADATAPVALDGPTLRSYGPEADDEVWEGNDPVTSSPRIFAKQAVPGYPLVTIIGLSDSDVYHEYIRRRNVYLATCVLLIFALIVAAICTILYVRNILSRNFASRALAETDALTGLGNRHKLQAFLNSHIEQSSVVPIALLSIDLNRFGQVNEAMGYEVGDALLRQVASRIGRAASTAAVVARTGGDEFVIGLRGAEAHSRALGIARTLIDQFAVAFGLRGRTYPVQISVGIASTVMGAKDSTTLRANANAAMDIAKKSARTSGHSEYVVYSQSMADSATQELAMMDGLVHALNHGGLSIKFVPVFAKEDSRQVGALSELLWQRSGKELVHESSFMDLARKKGLAYSLQSYALHEASRAIAVEGQATGEDMVLYVRMSIDLLASYTVVPDLNALELPANRLRLVLYDVISGPLSDVTVLQLRELRQHGALIYLQVSSGAECSLDLLHQVTVDGILLAAPTVQLIPADRAATAIARGLIATCMDMGLHILVGGVDSQAQYELLPPGGRIEYFGSYIHSARLSGDR
ncbi:bifunctional diguanylate cyclase/phosphodiesterase [Burkholderia alba]|uniref:bifunctional diguanylate cyclase/phosphodiesterase n=1 Tax=Burkholderia alba TaxID=2683677 RepID=UPI002B05F8C0|nr:diguanylate cyclase [Burkholderia alba]